MTNVLISRKTIQRGQTVECPYRGSIGAHEARVTYVDRVGDSRTVVSLSCGHEVNMADGHGLYEGEPS